MRLGLVDEHSATSCNTYQFNKPEDGLGGACFSLCSLMQSLPCRLNEACVCEIFCIVWESKCGSISHSLTMNSHWAANAPDSLSVNQSTSNEKIKLHTPQRVQELLTDWSQCQVLLCPLLLFFHQPSLYVALEQAEIQINTSMMKSKADLERKDLSFLHSCCESCKQRQFQHVAETGFIFSLATIYIQHFFTSKQKSKQENIERIYEFLRQRSTNRQ